MPDAPGLFSTITCWPRIALLALSRSAMTRATTSVSPPGTPEETSLIVRLG